MAKIRFWKWQYTDPLGKDHVMRSPLSRGPASLDLEHADRPEWSLPLGDLERPKIGEHAHGAPK
jgi:hypothetical protein